MDRRVLIVESQHDFALSMASVLKDAGYHTAMAQSATDAVRELEKRRPDLVVVRAELPDSSGFSLCGQIKKGKWGQNLRVLLLSSETGVEGLNQHAQSPGAADGYLAIPFEMGQLAEMTAGIVPPGDPDDMDASLDNAIARGTAPSQGPAADPPLPGVAPPPLRVAAGGPPKLPKRERRSSITEDDRAFIDRAFQSIAERKTELLAESRQSKRPAPRRELMGTPEGKIQILRDELKVREAQVARISEIWGVRERELLSVEDRLHEKDVELQGLKMQVDDLLRRFNDAQQTMVTKEREHGATVDDLLLQKFATEKDLIEVVAAKEKDINVLRKEISNRDHDLQARAAELETQRGEYDKLEKQLNVTTLEFEVKEQKLNDALKERGEEIASLKGEVAKGEELLRQTTVERDAKYAEYEGEKSALTEELEKTRAEREATVSRLQGELQAATERGDLAAEEINRLTAERAELKGNHEAELQDLEARLAETTGERDAARVQAQETAELLEQRTNERDAKIAVLQQELSETHARAEKTEAELQAQVQANLEKIGELEGELEAARTNETDLGDQVTQLTAKLEAAQAAAAAAAQAAQTEITSLQEQVFSLQTEGGVKDGTITDLQDQLAALNDAKDKLEQDLTARLTATDRALGQANDDLDRTREKLSAAEASLAATGGDLQATQTALAESQKSYDETLVQLNQTTEAKEKLQEQLIESQADVAALSQTRDQLESQLETTRTELSTTAGERDALKASLDETQAELATEQAAHQKLQQDSGAQIAGLETQLADLRDHSGSQDEQLAQLKNELGMRVQEVTQLSGQVAQLEEARQALDERLLAANEEAVRRDEIYQTDLAGKTKELSDTQRKLAQTTNEAKRQIEVLTRDGNAKTEQVKALEAKLKTSADEMQRAHKEMAQRLEATSNELESLKGEMAEKLTAAGNAHAQALAERDSIKSSLGSQLQQQNAKVQELTVALQNAKAEAKRQYDELFGKYSKTDSKLAQLTTESQARAAEYETKLKDTQGQLATRARKIQELELAVENSHAAKLRAEKEANAKVAAAEAKANDALAKLAAAQKEKKDAEGRAWKEAEELTAKHKAELDRREQLKAQEVARLQQTVQEKSKALKVVELELARYKTKGSGGATNVGPAPKPANTATGAKSIAAAFGEDEPATKMGLAQKLHENAPTGTNTHPVAKPATAQRPAVGHGTAPRTGVTQAPPAAKKGVPAASHNQLSEERTMMVQAPKSDDEWSSLVDELDK